MYKVLGISAGRKNKVSETVVRAVLDGAIKHRPSDISVDMISLSGKVIRPCEACNGCVDTNRCVLNDDFLQIMDALDEADALVFGAPTYWDHMNAKGQSFWERACFSARHNEVFSLKNKLGAIVAVDGTGDGRHVIRDVKRYFQDARMVYVDNVVAQGQYACFTCGYGSSCSVGGVAELYPLGTKITEDIIPTADNQHPEKRNDHTCAEQKDCGGSADYHKKTVIPEAKELGTKLSEEL